MSTYTEGKVDHEHNSSSSDVEKNKSYPVHEEINSIDESLTKPDPKNPFLDRKVAEHYRQVYEESQYECRGVFDPHFTWDPAEERKIVRKLDYRVALSACLMFCALQVDRGNIAQAVSDTLLQDLKLTTDDFNTGNTIFFVSFLFAELPSQLISKALGPDIFVPIQICLWSIVSLSQGWINNKASFYATRSLIGILEGGFIADLVLWLSYFYTSKELPIRLSWFWSTLSLVSIAASLAAFGILRLKGHLGLAGWRWLFIIEGIFTLLVGIASFYLMVPSAVQTKSRLHPKSWFTDREAKIVVNRVLRDDPSKGDMHNRQGLTPKMIWKSLIDYDLYPIYALGLFQYGPALVLETYQTINLRELGFSTLNTNLLTIPSSVISIIFLLLITWLSEKVNNRALLCLSLPIYAIPLMGVIAFWEGTMTNKWGTYTLITLMVGAPYIHAILVAWVSTNSNSIRSRSVASTVYNISVQIAAIYSKNVYRSDDAPIYRRGNMQVFAIAVAILPLIIIAKFYYIWRNNRRDKIWNAMSQEEQEDYINNTTDEGNKRLDFRFVH
ncbi:putative allantoate permease [Scheffersomyces coipomensis]|uniref:putative allantoate permease n=1 Tax=Scheffersomyces coipomensis TaxID=1788519 RepID=UPI00315D5799